MREKKYTKTVAGPKETPPAPGRLAHHKARDLDARRVLAVLGDSILLEGPAVSPLGWFPAENYTFTEDPFAKEQA